MKELTTTTIRSGSREGHQGRQAVMANPRTYVSNAELTTLVESFSKYLMCWKVGLRYGSQLYFEMGPAFERQIKPGVNVSAGASSLVLEGYNWTIYDSRRDVMTNSEMVSDEIVKEKLQPIFEKTILRSIRFVRDDRDLFLIFSTDLLIASDAQLSGDYIDDSLCLWVLPDGRLLSCDAREGFYLDGSVSEAHAKHFAAA
jgi:hypothetical protein